MKFHYILDEGLPVACELGDGCDTVASLQSAIKYLVKSKKVMACQTKDIQVYPLGVTIANYADNKTPLQPHEKLPDDSDAKNAIFVHVPRQVQDLTPEEKKLQAKQKQKQASSKTATAKPGRKQVPSDARGGASAAPKKALAKDPVTGAIWKSIPTTMDAGEQIKIQKFTCYYQLAGTVPYYIEIFGWETTVGRLKERILETRGQRGTAPDLFGVRDISMFKIYPPGRDTETGNPIHPELDDMDAPIPTNSTFEDPIIVPAVRDSAIDSANAANVQEQVRMRMLARKKAKEEGKKNKEEPITTVTTITIQVKTLSGTIIPVTINPLDTIQSIKEAIAPKVGVEVPHQILTFNDKELPNKESAQPAGLKDGSVISLQPSPITIQVKTPDGKTIAVSMKPTDSIKSMKEKIASEAGVKVSEQVLTFKDQELPDDRGIEAAGLKHGSIIDLQPNTITIQVKTPDGKTIPVTIKPTASIESIKEMVAPEVGIKVADQILEFKGNELPNDNSAEVAGLKDGSVIDLQPNIITIQVKTPDGKTIPVTIKPTDSIESIKEMVAPEAGIKVLDQILKFNGNELPNDNSAEVAGLKDGSVIDLQPNTITIQVKTPDGKTIPVTIKPTTNIQAIKETIAPEAGIKVVDQILKFNGNELPNDNSAEVAGLKHGSVIDLQPNTITIQVKTPDGKTLPVTIKPTTNIEAIKEMVANDAGIDVAEQILKFNDKELPNAASAEALGLKDGSIIHLQPQTINVLVKTPDGKTIPVSINPYDTIKSIKEKIASEAGVDVPEQVLTFNGKELPNNETAKALGLKNGSVINLEPQTITVQIKTPDGKTIPVTIKPSDTILSIKDMVAPKAGIEVPKQILTFESMELPNSETAEAMGLKDGAVIDLRPSTIQIQVKAPDGITITVHVPPMISVQAIKEAIAAEAGIEAPKQILKFNDKKLSNDDTAYAVGLEDGSVLDLSEDKAEARIDPKATKKESKKKKLEKLKQKSEKKCELTWSLYQN
jgi:FlaG/FlaF family flagellin (archaellin)